MDMFVFRADLATFSQMNKASVLNQACLLLSTLPRPLSFLGGGSFRHSRQVRGDQALSAEAAGLRG